ncbi:hypothetical protein [Ligilactobacillus aviarius]|uniref:hypothetical protein n=1 Tax=Ligilactobacillus aviarius TaxID=1606 RepID=UPI0024B8F733|nr:hypothetical protein [Ligilactobacillus aviarius]
MLNTPNLREIPGNNSFEESKIVNLDSDIHLKPKPNLDVNIRDDYDFIFLEGTLDGYSSEKLKFSNCVAEKLMCDPNIKNCLQDLLDDPREKLNKDKKCLEDSTSHYKETLKRLKKLICDANEIEEFDQEGNEEGLLESKFEGIIDNHGSVRVFSIFEDDLTTNKPFFVVLLIDPYHMAIPVKERNQKSFGEVKNLKNSIKEIFYDEEMHTKVNFMSKKDFLNQF